MEAIVKQATLGGGCFWCVETIFKRLKGIQDIMPGFSGGKLENPAYKQVYTGTTGHAEVVNFKYQPSIISYYDILQIFMHIHDPTSLNRQGEDVGTHYRSVIFYHEEEQLETARKVIKELEDSKAFDPKPIVTELAKFDKFYPAEDYHKNYFDLHPEQSYCQAVIAPKVQKFLKKYSKYCADEKQK